MSFSSDETFELNHDQQHIEGILPYIALDRMRVADFLDLVEPDESVTLVNPRSHVRLSLKHLSPSNGWHINGWEEASLSAGGSFPGALEEYSDGFIITMNNHGASDIRADHEHQGVAQPLVGLGLIALKDIMWGSSVAGVEELSDRITDRLSPKEIIDDPKEEYREAWGAYEHLCEFAHTVEQMKGLTDDLDDGSANKTVFGYGANDMADHLLEDFSAIGKYHGDKIAAWVHRTPAELHRRIPPTERIAKIGLNLSQVHTFFGVDNVPIETSMANFYFDQASQEVNIVPQDSLGVRIALDTASLVRLTAILRVLIPVLANSFTD